MSDSLGFPALVNNVHVYVYIFQSYPYVWSMIDGDQRAQNITFILYDW